jgi:Uma2 family endonuclease
MKNGCSLAWLINPESSTSFIYRKDGSVDKVSGFQNKLSGEDVLPGFELDLSIIK